MDRFAAMRSFRAVVEHDGFAAAAKVFGVSKASISKQVTALEAHLGATLLHRTTRRLSPTEAGRAFYADAVRILDDLAGAEEQVAEDQGVPRGLLRINAPLSFGVARLMPVVSAFMARHPQVRIDLALDDRPVDPVRHAFDLSLRIRTALDDSELMSRRIGGIAHVVCVARDYPTLPPQRPGDLVDHPMLVYAGDRAPTRDYRFETITGRSRVATHPYHPSAEDEQQSRDPRSIAVGRWRRRDPALRRRSRPCRGAARSAADRVATARLCTVRAVHRRSRAASQAAHFSGDVGRATPRVDRFLTCIAISNT